MFAMDKSISETLFQASIATSDVRPCHASSIMPNRPFTCGWLLAPVPPRHAVSNHWSGSALLYRTLASLTLHLPALVQINIFLWITIIRNDSIIIYERADERKGLSSFPFTPGRPDPGSSCSQTIMGSSPGEIVIKFCPPLEPHIPPWSSIDMKNPLHVRT